MKLYQFTENDVNEAATSGMHTGFNALVAEGILTREQADAFLETHAIAISTNTNWLRQFWEKVSRIEPPLDPKTIVYHCVKIVE